MEVGFEGARVLTTKTEPAGPVFLESQSGSRRLFQLEWRDGFPVVCPGHGMERWGRRGPSRWGWLRNEAAWREPDAAHVQLGLPPASCPCSVLHDSDTLRASASWRPCRFSKACPHPDVTKDEQTHDRPAHDKNPPSRRGANEEFCLLLSRRWVC